MSWKDYIISIMIDLLGALLVTMAVVALVSCFVSCCPCRHIATNHKDSIRIEYRERVVPQIRDTTIYVTIEKQEQSAIADTTSTLTNKFATTTATITKGKLHHNLITLPQRIESTAKIAEKVVYRDSIIYKDKHQTEIVERFVMRWWEKIFFYLGLIAVGGIVGIIVWKVR